MWQSSFMIVLKVTEKGVVLNDETKNRLLLIADLSLVMQFKLDGRVHNYQPHFHYDITINET